MDDAAHLPAALMEKVDNAMDAIFITIPPEYRLAAFAWAQMYCEAAIEAWRAEQ